MDVLLYLAERQGQMVSRSELMDGVWKDVAVSDSALSRTISQLRQLLEDRSRNPQIIETIAKSGYRLIAEVQPLGEPACDSSDTASHSLHLGSGPMAVPGGERERHHGARGPSGPPVPVGPTDGTRGGIRHIGGTRLIKILVTTVVFTTLTAVLSLAMLLREKHTTAQGFGTKKGTNKGPIFQPLTTLIGTESMPRFSPDGGRLAFAWDRGTKTNWDLYVKQLGEEHLLRLTHKPGNEHFPVWSPDGNYLYFFRQGYKTPAIYRVPALGGPESEITTIEGQLGGLAITPDGSHLIMAHQEGPGNPFRLFLLDLATNDRRRITDPEPQFFGDYLPAISPDGEWVAFVRSMARGNDIFVSRFPEGQPRQLTFDGHMVFDVDWTPDQAGLVFSSDRDSRRGLWVVNPDGGEPQWLGVESTETGLLKIAIRPGGKSMALAEIQEDYNLWMRDLSKDGSMSKNRLVASTRTDYNASFSPNGKAMTFLSDRTGKPGLWVIGTNGTHLRMLTELQSMASGVAHWSPDGTTLVFADYTRLFRVPARGGTPRLLTGGDWIEVNPRWTKDGQHIVFNSNRDGFLEIWRMRADGSETAAITNLGVNTMLLGCDRVHVFFLRQDRNGVWRVPLIGGQPEMAYDFDHPPMSENQEEVHPITNEDWHFTERGVYFVDHRPGEDTIRYYDFETNTMKTLERSQEDLHCVTITADGKRLVFSSKDTQTADLVLMASFGKKCAALLPNPD
ncbi:PD40 domain-containing protein [Sulfidibacter corallicola]|uniref:PD40 domain-containing protein n=2 Tax=Sulfidibacter corallicola TaxID=2818388 RepID=A0A8A4TPN7_SULCO|nr:PD40 domain-containing protein [Sulfidibacter corallicola]